MVFLQEINLYHKSSIINLDGKKVKEHIGFYYLLMKIQLCTFDSFGTEYIPQEVLSKIKEKSISNNLFRIQDDDSVMGGFHFPFI